MAGLENDISTSATEPRKASGDSGSMEQHSLPDQIAADRYLKSTEAAKNRKAWFRLAKLVPPGAV